jgi:UDP-N-acetylmuramate dehydrogenase
MENDYIILKVTLHLEKADQKIIMSLVEDRKKRRIQSQPLEYPSAGSVYRNPKENYAGKLIEDLGLKGKTFKGAKISDKHANFIINYENAKSSDIKYLMDLVENSVFEKYNIRLKREQELFNWE